MVVCSLTFIWWPQMSRIHVEHEAPSLSDLKEFCISWQKQQKEAGGRERPLRQSQGNGLSNIFSLEYPEKL